ncbi:MAG: DsrE/DsrF/TusD sulfur relay family protein [Thermoleophilia bacterium]
MGKGESAVLIINEGSGSMKSWNGLRLAAELIDIDMKIEIFLMDDGVMLGKAGQQMVAGLAELESAKKLVDLIGHGASVKACGTCLGMKGINQEDLIDGIDVAGIPDLANLVKECDRVLVF